MGEGSEEGTVSPPQNLFGFFCLGRVHFECILTHDYTVHNARIKAQISSPNCAKSAMVCLLVSRIRFTRKVMNGF